MQLKRARKHIVRICTGQVLSSLSGILGAFSEIDHITLKKFARQNNITTACNVLTRTPDHGGNHIQSNSTSDDWPSSQRVALSGGSLGCV